MELNHVDDLKGIQGESQAEAAGMSRFIWLRQYEVGQNSAGVVRLLDRLEFLQELGVSPTMLVDISGWRIRGAMPI